MLNKFKQTFMVTEMRIFKHKLLGVEGLIYGKYKFSLAFIYMNHNYDLFELKMVEMLELVQNDLNNQASHVYLSSGHYCN